MLSRMVNAELIEVSLQPGIGLVSEDLNAGPGDPVAGVTRAASGQLQFQQYGQHRRRPGASLADQLVYRHGRRTQRFLHPGPDPIRFGFR